MLELSYVAFHTNVPCDEIFLLARTIYLYLFNDIGHNFRMIDVRVFILHMSISCDKIFLLVSRYTLKENSTKISPKLYSRRLLNHELTMFHWTFELLFCLTSFYLVGNISLCNVIILLQFKLLRKQTKFKMETRCVRI